MRTASTDRSRSMLAERRRRRFKDVAYADLNARPFEAEKTSPNFRVHRLSEFYYSYGSAIADINRDGNLDVIGGPYYYLGPDFTVGRQLYTVASFNPDVRISSAGHGPARARLHRRRLA